MKFKSLHAASSYHIEQHSPGKSCCIFELWRGCENWDTICTWALIYQSPPTPLVLPANKYSKPLGCALSSHFEAGAEEHILPAVFPKSTPAEAETQFPKHLLYEAVMDTFENKIWSWYLRKRSLPSQYGRGDDINTQVTHCQMAKCDNCSKKAPRSEHS